MTEFDDLTKRILDSIDKMKEDIKKLCQEQQKQKAQFSEHIKVETALEEYKKEIKNELTSAEDRKFHKRDRRFYYIIALMGIGFTVQEIIRSLL